METKVETKIEYMIILTEEEAEILSDALEYVSFPLEKEKGKKAIKYEYTKKYNFVKRLVDNICDLLEINNKEHDNGLEISR